MIDRPDRAALLRAMAKTLSNEVLPATSGSARHAARVVANLCLILEREESGGRDGEDETRTALEQLLDQQGSLEQLVAELDRRLTDDTDEAFEARAHEVLLSSARRRLAIDRPGYDR